MSETPPSSSQPTAPMTLPRRRQLRLRRPHLDDLPEMVIPSGYRLRTYRPGDALAWGAIMEAPEGIGGEWTLAKIQEQLLDRPQFEPAGLFLATSDAEAGQPVASACAWRAVPEEGSTGLLHMVCALAEHRGRGLGRLVCLAVLQYLRERRFTSAELLTDDFRLAAIKSYLALGFVPVYLPDPEAGDGHEARWSAIFTGILGTARPGQGR